MERHSIYISYLYIYNIIYIYIYIYGDFHDDSMVHHCYIVMVNDG